MKCHDSAVTSRIPFRSEFIVSNACYPNMKHNRLLDGGCRADSAQQVRCGRRKRLREEEAEERRWRRGGSRAVAVLRRNLQQCYKHNRSSVLF